MTLTEPNFKTKNANLKNKNIPLPNFIHIALLKCLHFILAMTFWTTGIIKSIFSAFFSITMHSMLKGSELSDIHNLTSSPKHVAVIISKDWADISAAGASSANPGPEVGAAGAGFESNNLNTVQLDVLSQILVYLILSGVFLITVYDQSGKLCLGREILEKRCLNALSEACQQNLSAGTTFNNYNTPIPKFRIIYETRNSNGSGCDKSDPNQNLDPSINNYTLNLKSAINRPLNGMTTFNRINYMQSYKFQKGDSAGTIQEQNYSEPELALVLDPKNKKSIFGFNFWAIRLTEFIFLNQVRPSLYSLKKSMEKYLKVEKRLGK